MRFEFKLPDLGEGMAEVEIISWYVSVGDDVVVDQPLLTVETDKLITDLPSPVAGRVVDLSGSAGDKVPVGQTLLRIDVVGAADDAISSDQEPVGSGRTVAVVGMQQPSEPAAGQPGTRSLPTRLRVKAAPAVRRLALEQAVDLSLITGTGPDGRVTRDDVLAAASRPPEPIGGSAAGRKADPASEARGGNGGVPRQIAATHRLGDRLAMTAMRRQIAQNLVESWTRIPQCVDFREIDAGGLVETRRAIATERGGDSTPSFVAFMVKFAAATLLIHPLFNAKLDEARQEIVIDSEINIGIATATADGILVPVLRNADRKSLDEITEEADSIAERARARRLVPSELRRGTFTVNNIGSLNPRGGGFPTPLINWPEVAILGFGRITDRVVAIDGISMVRPTMMLTVTGDHRLVDGAEMAAFTNTLTDFIRDPRLLLPGLR